VAARLTLLLVLSGFLLYPVAGGSVQDALAPPARIVLSGQVDVVPGPGQTLLVLVDRDSEDRPADGLVDLAFRLQQAPPLAFSGRATVTYVSNRVTIAAGDGAGWVFTVAGRIAASGEADAAYPHFAVVGLSRSWGPSVHATVSQATARLLAGGCGVPTVDGGGDPLCEACQAGGRGAQACSVTCDEGLCAAECSADFFACCNCSLGCGCCPTKEGGVTAK